MAYSLVAHGAQNNGSGSVTIDTTGANLLLVQVGAFDGNPIAVPTDSKGNSGWAGLTNVTSASAGAGRLFWVVPDPAKVGSGHTFTTGALFPSICVQAWSGAHASPFDQQAPGSNGATSPAGAGGALTPAAANALVVATWAEASTATPTIDGGFTISDTAPGIGGTSYGSSMAYLVQTTAVSANPSWTWSGAAAGVELTVFLAATGGGGAGGPLVNGGPLSNGGSIARGRIVA